MTGYFIMVGPTRTSTTSLFRYFSGEKRVNLSKKKEANYFLGRGVSNKFFSENEYRSLFADESCGDLFLDASPLYFMKGHKVASVIKNTLPDARIIITLRDPVERFFSLYRHIVTKRSIADFDDSLADLNEFIDRCLAFTPDAYDDPDNINDMSFHEGCYAELLEQWLSVFGAQSVKVVFYEHLVSMESRQHLDDLLDWMGLSDSALKWQPLLHENKSRAVKSAYLHNAAMRLNNMVEPLLTRNHRLRHFVRDTYYSLNEGKSSGVRDSHVSSAQKNKVEQAYAQRNRGLKSVLAGMGVVNCPPWVR